MGFDSEFPIFSNYYLEVRKRARPPAVICDCGKATVNHTLRERRKCYRQAACSALRSVGPRR